MPFTASACSSRSLLEGSGDGLGKAMEAESKTGHLRSDTSLNKRLHDLVSGIGSPPVLAAREVFSTERRLSSCRTDREGSRERLQYQRMDDIFAIVKIRAAEYRALTDGYDAELAKAHSWGHGTPEVLEHLRKANEMAEDVMEA